MDIIKYVKFKRYGAWCVNRETGMDEETVIRLKTELGCTDIEFITEEEFNAFVKEQRVARGE